MQTALHSACASGHHEVVKILLEAGAPTSKMYEESGEMKGNALTLAIAMHNRECVKVFLETATDNQGRNSNNTLKNIMKMPTKIITKVQFYIKNLLICNVFKCIELCPSSGTP